ncbi:hypothetical protein [Flavobacterium sp.]|jgi:hypothetical protein|uniref:hypothetical protein n=1 Tax=Flavobacterium sp. TaxID=239 RepID=UPI0037C105DC
MKKSLLFFLIVICYSVNAQVGIGTKIPNPSSALDISSTSQGVLLPRVSLSSTTDETTIVNGNVEGLIVYNTSSVSDVKPGYYYYSNNKWNLMAVSDSSWNKSGNVGTDENVDFIGTTDSQNVVIKVNNTPSIIANKNGSVEIANGYLVVNANGGAAVVWKDKTVDPFYYWEIDKRNLFGTNSNYNFNLVQYNPDIPGVYGWLFNFGVENNDGVYRTNQVMGDPYGNRIHKLQFNSSTGGTGDYPAFAFFEQNGISTKDIFRVDKASFSNIFKITSNGDVLIGSTTTNLPTAKLEVAGKIKAVDINFTGLPTYNNDTEASDLVAGDMYKTVTGELRIKL